MKVEVISYDELSEDEQRIAPNSGSGKDVATYMRITYEDGDSHVESDAMEPEDATFYRDLSWVASAIESAYKQGLKDAAEDRG